MVEVGCASDRCSSLLGAEVDVFVSWVVIMLAKTLSPHGHRVGRANDLKGILCQPGMSNRDSWLLYGTALAILAGRAFLDLSRCKLLSKWQIGFFRLDE
jgi:hypothetical protein